MSQVVLTRRLSGLAAVIGTAIAVLMTAGPAAAAGPTVSVDQVPIKFVGTVNLAPYIYSGSPTHSSLRAFKQGASLAGASATGSYRIADPAIARRRQASKAGVTAATTPITLNQVPGESGFSALTGYDQAVVNGNVDLEPPDQGLCAGNGDVADFINNAFAVYDTNGVQLLNTVPSYALFKQPSTAFLSDPRCYYDASTQRWFLTEFIFGNARAPCRASSSLPSATPRT